MENIQSLIQKRDIVFRGDTVACSTSLEQRAAGAAGGTEGTASASSAHPLLPGAPDKPDDTDKNSNTNPCDIDKCSTNFIFDNNLIVDCEKCIQTLKTVTKNSKDIDDKLKLDPYPSDYILAQLALKAYSDNLDDEIQQKSPDNPEYETQQKSLDNLDYETQQKSPDNTDSEIQQKSPDNPDDETQQKSSDSQELPNGWKLLTTARNSNLFNGYFGAAFWCPDQQQVVVAHRGTEFMNPGAWWTNVRSINWNKVTSHVCSAVTFTEVITTILKEVNKEGTSFQLSITGHSLGGWLAQVTTFTIKYLQKDNLTFRKLTNIKDGFHAHTVVFDSPGCRSMLSTMKDTFDQRYERSIFLRRLDISSYLSAPNRINSLNLHLGIIYRIVTDLSDLNTQDEYTLGYTTKTHSMKKMVQALEHVQNALNVFEILDWPLRSILWGEEYNKFFKVASHENKFHQQTDRYEFKTINRNCCSLRIFSEDELLILDAWMILIKSNMNITNLIDNLTISHLFDEFVIDKEKQTITCTSEESIKKLIRHTKALMRWLPIEVIAATKKQAALVPLAAEAMFRAEANNYLCSLERSQLDFRDTLQLEAFLTSSNNILIIRNPNSDVEMVRLLNIFQQITIKWNYLEKTNDHCSFINLKGIKRLESAVNIQGLFQSCFTKDYLFIIQCTENNIKTCETILIEILNNLKKNPNNKLVFVESHDTGFNDLVKLFYNFVLKHSQEIKLNDLTEDSVKELFQQKIILLQGELLSLRELVGEYCHLTAEQQNDVNTLIGPQILKNLLTIDNYVIQVEDTLLHHNDLHIHSTFNKEVSVMRVARALEHSNDVLLVISGIGQKEMKTNWWRELVHALGEERISATIKQGESIFKKMCREKPSATIYWFAASAELLHCKSIYKKEFYIERKFVISKYIFDFEKFAQETNKDKYISQNNIFVFKNIVDKKSLISPLLISEGDKNIFLRCECIKTVASPEEADDIIGENPGKAVHILKREAIGGLILWQRSRGFLEGLRQCVTAGMGELVDESELHNTSQGVVILADEPGMGKSTSLTSMSRLLRSSAWVIRVDLKHFQIPIQDPPTDLSLSSVCEFILRDKDSWLRMLLYFCLDKRNKHSRKVYLLFDGFDEIKQNSSQTKKCIDEVLRLLKYLNSETTARIWITTRLYRKEMLENELSIFAMQFEKVSESRQREYLVEFWRPHLLLEVDQYGDVEERKLQDCAEYVFQNAKQVLGDDVQNFMGIPLQMRMLAEISMLRVKDYVESESDIGNTFDVKSVFGLYQQFVSLKYDIYFSNKTGLNADMSEHFKNSSVKQFTESHRLLALRTLFPEFAKEHFDDPEAGWEVELCTVGLVQSGGVGGENIEFIHRTLAEHFIADLTIDWLRKKGRYHGHAPMVELLLAEILLWDSHKVIRKFCNNLILLQPLSQDANNFNALKICEIWCDDVKQNSLFNHDIDTALHIAVKEGNTGIIDILIGGLKCESAQKGLITFITAHDRERYTALGRAARVAGSDRVSEIVKCTTTEIIKKFIQSVETCPNEVILELLLATYITHTPVLDNEIDFLSEYVEGENVCPAINKAYTRTQKIIHKYIPRLGAAVKGDSSRIGTKNVEELYSKIENDTERRYMLLAPGGGEWGGTALHLAAEGGGNEELKKIRTQIIRNLCNHNIPQVGRSIDGIGQTPLHIAAGAGQLDIVKHFINHGVYIDSLTRLEGETALFRAACGRRLPVVEYLVEKGSNINIVNRDGENVLFDAARSGSLPLVKYLVKKGSNITIVNNTGETALFFAAHCGSLPVVEYLVEKGSNINIVNRDGENVLFDAARSGSLPLVKYLVKKGSNITIVNNTGETALFFAAHCGSLPVVEYLENNGSDIYIVNRDGESALFFATRGKSLPVVKYLVEKGSNINIVNRDGENVLFDASRSGSHPLVEYLVGKGSDITVVNNKGETAQDIATVGRDQPTAHELCKAVVLTPHGLR